MAWNATVNPAAKAIPAGATSGSVIASATSADAGGPADRVVGYLGAAFEHNRTADRPHD